MGRVSVLAEPHRLVQKGIALRAIPLSLSGSTNRTIRLGYTHPYLSGFVRYRGCGKSRTHPKCCEKAIAQGVRPHHLYALLPNPLTSSFSTSCFQPCRKRSIKPGALLNAAKEMSDSRKKANRRSFDSVPPCGISLRMTSGQYLPLREKLRLSRIYATSVVCHSRRSASGIPLPSKLRRVQEKSANPNSGRDGFAAVTRR